MVQWVSSETLHPPFISWVRKTSIRIVHKTTRPTRTTRQQQRPRCAPLAAQVLVSCWKCATALDTPSHEDGNEPKSNPRAKHSKQSRRPSVPLEKKGWRSWTKNRRLRTNQAGQRRGNDGNGEELRALVPPPRKTLHFLRASWRRTAIPRTRPTTATIWPGLLVDRNQPGKVPES